MGTSRNDPSFGVSEWNPASSILGRESVSVDRQLLALWRAAVAGRTGQLVGELGSELIADACKLVSERVDVHEGIERYTATAAEARLSGLYVEVGKRALAAVLERMGTESDFAGELFSRTVSYFVARDLPSFVGAEGRIPNVVASIDLKAELASMTRAKVEDAGPPDASAPEAWRAYVEAVIVRLTTREPA